MIGHVNEFGEFLRMVRTENNLTLQKLAEDTGLTQAFLSMIENGKRSPSLHTLILLASILGFEVRISSAGLSYEW